MRFNSFHLRNRVIYCCAWYLNCTRSMATISLFFSLLFSPCEELIRVQLDTIVFGLLEVDEVFPLLWTISCASLEGLEPCWKGEWLSSRLARHLDGTAADGGWPAKTLLLLWCKHSSSSWPSSNPPPSSLFSSELSELFSELEFQKKGLKNEVTGS